jgi:uncharacterized protein YjbI with pentapeptide repeats
MVSEMLKNLEGKMLVDTADFDKHDLSERDLRRADFRRISAMGLTCIGANLQDADFSYCSLYWLDMYVADCTGAIFRHAKLQGVNFASTCLQRADFSFALITHDNLGAPSTFVHADLTGANLEGADLSGTEYDTGTIFPVDFDPNEHGMILVRETDESLVQAPCKKIKAGRQ